MPRTGAPRRPAPNGAPTRRASANPPTRRPGTQNAQRTNRPAGGYRGNTVHPAYAQNVKRKPPFLKRLKLVNKDIFSDKRRLFSVLLVSLVLLYDEIMLRLFCGVGLFQNLFYPLVFGLALGLFIEAIGLLLPPRGERFVRSFALVLTGILFSTEALIRNSFQQYYSIAEIIFGSRGVATEYTSDMISAITHGFFKIILFMVPPILHVIFAKKKIRFARRGRRLLAAEAILCSLALFVVGSLTVNLSANSEFYAENYAFTAAADSFGLLSSVRLEGKYAAFGNKAATSFVALDATGTAEETQPQTSFDASSIVVEGNNESDIDFKEWIAKDSGTEYEDLDTYCMVTPPTNKNAYTGLFKGKNLILITAEAFSSVVVSQELTPTLYRMVHNGFYFSDAYQPAWGGSTSSGEFSFLFGMAPENVKSMKKSVNNNNYYLMGSRLSAEGYYSVAFHNGMATFYDRNITHMNLGYQDYIARDGGLNELANGKANDELMFQVTLEAALNHQPFNLYYMTVSGHATYVDDQDSRVLKYGDRVRAYLNGKYSDHIVNYFCYQMVLEDALTTMIKMLEDAGIADDTVIALCTDHYPYGLAKSDTMKNDRDYLIEFYGENYESRPWDQDRTDLIIWSGALENDMKSMWTEVKKPVSSIDMLPTLLNLYGIEYDSRLLAGRDAFCNEEGVVFWNNASWVTEKGYYTRGKFTSRDGSEVDQDYIKRINNLVKNRLSFSRQAVDLDYWGHLFGPSATQGGKLDSLTTDHSHLIQGMGYMPSQNSIVPTNGGNASDDEIVEDMEGV